ncbi:hypothetical protein HDU98_003571 [Podochytrium sp. JEL0797]|nr:hypothetical protein HDU98_003571 [Podochytrium sp. JEL0797]
MFSGQPPFTPPQRDALRLQIQAFKLLSTSQALPQPLAQLLFQDIASPAPPEDDSDSDDNDERNSLFDFKTTIDPTAIVVERERRIAARINHRIRYALILSVDVPHLISLNLLSGHRSASLLESLPSNLSNECDPDQESSLKLRALIELKSLKLLDKQKALRESIYLGMTRNTTLLTSIDRNMYRRQRKITLREARQTEAIEAERRGERERREKARLAEYLSAVVSCGRDLLNLSRNNTSKFQKLGQSVLKYHTVIEKEEQKRSQRVSQERLKALKENDEGAYLKLLDEAKDGRIMQILNKTNSYLSNLASAVVTQQDTVSAEDPGMVDPTEVEESGGAGVDYYAVAHKIKEKVEKQSSLLVGGQLKDYQIKGLEWMISLYNNRLNGILADEMGLGKTIQTISLITYLIEHKKQVGPYLVIIPLATVTNWTLEFEKWAPGVSKLVFKGGPEERRRTAQQIRNGNFQVLITTYEYIIREKAVLSKIKWVYMIIDEGHRMKNANSKLSVTLMQYYHTRYRVILTGTPLQNNLPELWALLNFILPKIFNSVKSFDEWFSSPFSIAGSANVELNEEERLLMIKGLHKVLRPFLLRRLKKDVEKELPDKVETIVKCPMSALQRKITERVKYLRNIGPFDQTKLSGTKALNNLVMQFRKICNHPFVFPEVENLVLPEQPEFTTEMVFRASGKFELLDRILPKYFRTGHRILMFFQMTQVMNIAEDFFRFRGWKHLRLDGAVKGEDREVLLKEFNRPGSDYNIFILSTRAGGLGLNLQTADTVIIFDSDWNPHQDLQAQDRAHRIGQKKEVRILRLITSNSIEEHILQKAQEKLALDGKIIQAGKFDQKTSEKDREELLRVLFEAEKKEEDAGEEGDNEELTDEQLNEMLARSPEEVEIFTEMDKERVASEMIRYNGNPPPRLISEKELPECYAIDFSKLKPAEADDLLSIAPRERRDVHYGEVLTEKQFLEAADKGTLHEVEQMTLDRRAARKAAGAPLDEEDGPTDAFDDEGDEEEFVQDDEDEDVVRTKKPAKQAYTPSASGKKRGKKSKAELLANDRISLAEREQLTKVGHACLAAVREATFEEDGDSRLMSEVFEDLPSKRAYRDYYDVITSPICLNEIQKKINGMRYYSLAEVCSDFALLFKNARTYNAEGTPVFDDANELERIFNETYAAHMSGNPAAVQKRKRDDSEDVEGGLFARKDLPRFRKAAAPSSASGSGVGFDDEDDEESSTATPKRVVKKIRDESDEDDYENSKLMPQRSLPELPTEILLNILAWMEYDQALSCRFICRRLKAVVWKMLKKLDLFQNICTTVYNKTRNSRVSPSHWLCCWDETQQNAAARVCLAENTPNFVHVKCHHGNPAKIPPSFGITTFTQITIKNAALMGPIPAELFQLTRMKVLNLSGNALEGTVPDGIHRLTRLTTLILSNNRFSGELPIEQLVGLENLRVLRLDKNQFVGVIPPCLESLKKSLVDVDFSHNQLEGAIPTYFHAFEKLATLNLGFNRLTGGIPAEAEGWKVLRLLDLQSNQLEGTIPECVLSMEKLEKIILTCNKLSGSIPVFRNANLLWIELGDNRFEGEVPDALVGLLKLRLLNVGHNQLSGKLDVGFRNVKWLADVKVHGNRLLDVGVLGGGKKIKWTCDTNCMSCAQ